MNCLGKSTFLHAYGPIYALSANVVESIVNLGRNRHVISEERMPLLFAHYFPGYS